MAGRTTKNNGASASGEKVEKQPKQPESEGYDKKLDGPNRPSI